MDKGAVIQKLFHVLQIERRHVCASYDALKPVIGRKKARRRGGGEDGSMQSRPFTRLSALALA